MMMPRTFDDFFQQRPATLRTLTGISPLNTSVVLLAIRNANRDFCDWTAIAGTDLPSATIDDDPPPSSLYALLKLCFTRAATQRGAAPARSRDPPSRRARRRRNRHPPRRPSPPPLRPPARARSRPPAGPPRPPHRRRANFPIPSKASLPASAHDSPRGKTRTTTRDHTMTQPINLDTLKTERACSLRRG